MEDKKKWLLFLGISLIGVLLDQATKFFAREFFSSPKEIASFLFIVYRTNSGALWGMMQGYNWLFILISFLAVGAILYFFRKEELKPWPQLFLALILAGAIGNLLDRLIFGYVTDFIEFSFWPTFNLADSFISLGVGGVLIYFFQRK